MNTTSQQKQRGAALANLLLLICVAGLLAGGWFGWQHWQGWQQQASRQSDQLAELQRTLETLQAQRQDQAQRLEALETALTDTGEALDSLRAGGQRDWLINEAGALASLAQQRLLQTGDIEAADRLLAAADQVLARADDADLLPARRALAKDRQALDGARQVDTAGLVLRLAALQDRVVALTVTTPPAPAEPAPVPEQGDWLDALIARLPVKVRHFDQAVPLPLDESQASLLRLTLNALLEQAQLALLQGRAQVYRESLGQARQILATWFADDHAVASELNRALTALADAPVEQALPDIGAGLKALRQLQGSTP